MKKAVFKSRFVAYKLFKGGKRIPGLLTVSQGRLVPEFHNSAMKLDIPYIASWPLSSQGSHVHFATHNKAGVAEWKKYLGADKVQRIIVESEYEYYK